MSGVKTFFCFLFVFFSSSDIALREISFFHKKLNFFSNPPYIQCSKTWEFGDLNENVDIMHLETIPKESEMCSVEHQNAQKLEFLQKPPVDSMFKNIRIWWFEWKCWYCAPGDDSKRFRKCVQLAPKWSKKSGLDGILVQMGPKIPQNELSKTHTSPLSKSFRHKITILSSSVFALTDFFYFEKMQVISCDL